MWLKKGSERKIINNREFFPFVLSSGSGQALRRVEGLRRIFFSSLLVQGDP